MSVNLSQQVQQQLGYPALEKIDPNVQAENGQQLAFSQAAIPAVLTALYKYVQSDTGAEDVLRGGESTGWVRKIFHGNDAAAVEKIRSYAGSDVVNAEAKMDAIAYTAIKIMLQNLTDGNGIKEVKTFFLNQRNNILPYLAPQLSLGSLLHDDTIDDNTNKMEGPVSSLMNSIGSAFSNPVTNEDVNKI